MSRFEPKLIQDAIACFREQDGVVLSESEAVAALEALGGLFLALTGEKGGGEPEGGALAPRGNGDKGNGDKSNISSTPVF